MRKSNRICFLLWIICALIPVLLPAQTTGYSVNEGLSQSTVTVMFQDSKGFMWVGTGYGLNRFDGYSFTTFKNDPHDPNSISDNCTRGIIEDTINHLLWIGTEDGLDQLDLASGKFTNVLKDDNSFRKHNIIPFWLEKEKVWFTAPAKGIFYYDTKNKRTVKVVSEWISREIFKGEICNRYWYVGQSGKLNCFHTTGEQTETYDLPAGLSGYPALHVTEMDSYWLLLCTEKGLYTLNRKTRQVTEASLGDAESYTKNRSITHARRDNHGNYWLSITNAGVYAFSSRWKLLHKYETQPASLPGFVFDNVSNIYNDRSDNIWIGTNDNGLGRININNTHFSNGLTGHFIKCFYVDDEKRLWTGTFNKDFFVVDRAKGKSVQVTQKMSGLTSPTITFFFEAKDGNLYVGTENELALIDKRTYKCMPVKCNEPFCKDIRTSCMAQTSDGSLWLGTRSAGLHKLVNVPGQKPYLEPVGERGCVISTLYEDKKGNLLVAATDNQLFIISPGGSIKKVFDFRENKLFGGNISIRSFAEDSKGNLWGATDIGLVRFTDDYKPAEVIDEHDGLSDNFVYSILKAPDGKFWLSTNKGISRFDPATLKCRSYTVEDGLQSNEFNTGAFFQSPGGEFFFGGVNGYNSFYPEQVNDNPFIPAVTLDEFSVFDSPYKDDTLAGEKRSFVLPYSSNTISFVLSALEYTDPSRNSYAYKLEGQDADYFYSGTKRFVRYSGLAPGTYHFWAKAANADGIWGPPRKMFTLVITPPFWQATWFRIICGLLVILLIALGVYLFARVKFRRQVAVLERQHEIEQVRNRISKDIHDDIGAGLTRIALISEATRMEIKQEKDIDSRLQTLSGTAREMADSLREIVWSMNPVHDNLPSLLGFMRNYGHNFFEDLDISIHMNFPEKIDSEEVSPEFRRNLFMITKEAFNNIAKHACAEKVELSFTVQEKSFEMKISDNGKGFSISEEKQFSNGLMNMKKRAEEIRCTFEVASMKDKGSVITLKGKLC